MAFSEIFNDDLSVTVGNPTKASEYNNVANNTDAVKERLVVGHWMNNTGVTNEDGFHKGDYDDPLWLFAKDTGNVTTKYGGLFLSVDGDDYSLRAIFGSATAAGGSPTAGVAIGAGLSITGAKLNATGLASLTGL